MNVTYLDHMGSDLSVVNAARVSFDKDSKEIRKDFKQIGTRIIPVPVVDTRDRKLINYLAEHGHWSPFAHTSIQMRWKAPIFVARQLAKHQVGLSWNEVSRRYVQTAPELYWPKKWRKAADNVKQGSSEEEFWYPYLDEDIFKAERLVTDYFYMVEQGMCPEQARMFLPQNTYTEWIWTGSLYAWARVFNQRTDPTAQKETRDLVLTLDEICGKLFPVSWNCLTKESQNG